MKKVLILVCVLVMSVAGFGQAKKTAAATKSPYVGVWKLDASSENPTWKSATLTITRDNDKTFAWSMRGVGKDGKAFNHPSMVATKDKESPMGKTGDTMTYNSDRSFTIKGKDGSVEDLKMSMSDDNKTLKVDGTGTDKDGKKQDVHDVWTKAGAAKKAAAKPATAS